MELPQEGVALHHTPLEPHVLKNFFSLFSLGFENKPSIGFEAEDIVLSIHLIETFNRF